MSDNNHKPSSRIGFINNAILQKMKSIYALRKVGFDVVNDKKIYAYTVSLKRGDIYSLIEKFCDTCENLINDNERFTTHKKYFKIFSDELEIYYYIEIWGKSADRMVYIEDGQLKIEFLHRMSCEQASRVLSKHDIKLINTSEVLRKYDTYADKYVALAKLPLFLSTLHNDAGDIKNQS